MAYDERSFLDGLAAGLSVTGGTPIAHKSNEINLPVRSGYMCSVRLNVKSKYPGNLLLGATYSTSTNDPPRVGEHWSASGLDYNSQDWMLRHMRSYYGSWVDTSWITPEALKQMIPDFGEIPQLSAWEGTVKSVKYSSDFHDFRVTLLKNYSFSFPGNVKKTFYFHTFVTDVIHITFNGVLADGVTIEADSLEWVYHNYPRRWECRLSDSRVDWHPYRTIQNTGNLWKADGYGAGSEHIFKMMSGGQWVDVPQTLIIYTKYR